MSQKKPVYEGNMFVSIDFDYFIREKIIWDWGHNERPDVMGLFSNAIWIARYSSPNIDVFKETEPKTYADFEPLDILKKLREKGLKFTSRTKMAIADSHEKAYEFFVNGNKKKPEIMLHIDAHHDMYSQNDEVHCGNWMYHFTKQFPKTKVYYVYPKWALEEGLFDKQLKPLIWTTFDKLPVFKKTVDKLFVCRSSVWTPPHHDQTFEMMVQLLAMFSGIQPQNVIDYGVIKRNAPTYEETQKMREETKKAMEMLHVKVD